MRPRTITARARPLLGVSRRTAEKHLASGGSDYGWPLAAPAPDLYVAMCEWQRCVPAGAPLVLCGVNRLTEHVLRAFPDAKVGSHPIVCVLDNDREKWGRSVGGMTVFPVSLVDHFNDAIYVTCLHASSAAVRAQLIGLGVDPARIVHYITLFRGFPDDLLPYYGLDRPESYDIERLAAVRALLEHDVESRESFSALVRSITSHDYLPLDRHADPALMYFDPTIYRFLEGERYVDCGAFDGDTLVAFRCSNKSDKATAIAIEPNPEVFEQLKLVWGRRPAITLVNAALTDDPDAITLTMAGDSVYMAASATGDKNVPATTLDKLLKHDRTSLCKIDCEGSEMAILRGGAATIKRDRPAVVCCTYHRPGDIADVPLYLHELMPDARIFFRHYAADWGESCVYAVPTERTV